MNALQDNPLALLPCRGSGRRCPFPRTMRCSDCRKNAAVAPRADSTLNAVIYAAGYICGDLLMLYVRAKRFLLTSLQRLLGQRHRGAS